MIMFFDTATIIGYVFGIIVLYAVCLFFIKPIKFIFRIVLNCAFGAVMLWGINFVGGILGVQLGINLFNSVVAGYMGIPGVILLFVIKMLI